MRATASEALVAYVPVLHKGYLELFNSHSDADMYVLGDEILAEFDYLRKDLRALSPELAVEVVSRLRIFSTVKLLGHAGLNGLEARYEHVTMPDDDISHTLSSQFSDHAKISYEPIFLRWDRLNSTANTEVMPDRTVRADDDQEKIVEILRWQSKKATSWWRRVGAAIVKDRQVLLSAHNSNMPTDYSAAIDGDPRSTLRRGMGIEITNDAHAEAVMIARAARYGTPLEGSDLYVDTFPCPKCAKDIVNAGIRRVYFIDGYAVADGYMVLKSAGIEIIRLITEIEPTDDGTAIPYPEK